MSTQRVELAVPVGDGGVTLEAIHAPGEAGSAVVAPPHPEMGGELHNPVVQALAAGLGDAGLGWLCFNWRGVGRSDGAISAEPRQCRQDYAAAVSALHARAGKDAALMGCGYSFGAATALAVAIDSGQLGSLLLVAPPVRMLAGLSLEDYAGRVVVIAGDDDDFAPMAELDGQLARLGRAELHRLPGVDHFFQYGGLERLADVVSSALGA